MINETIQDAEQRMQKTLVALKDELVKIRTGRAHPSLLEQVMVNYYGSDVPLSQTANISVLDARTLSVTPFDKSTVQAIEKAIMNADLGLNPVTTGELIRIPLPALTEDRRKDLVKLVRAEAEKSKVALRNVRRQALQECKEMVKEKMISEDDERGAQDQVQKLIDKYVVNVDEVLKVKEQDVMEV